MTVSPAPAPGPGQGKGWGSAGRVLASGKKGRKKGGLASALALRSQKQLAVTGSPYS